MPANYTINTLLEYHREKKWLFKEKGLEAMWNEYQAMFTAVLSGPPATIGAADFVTNLAPDFVQGTYDTGHLDGDGNVVDPPAAGFRG